MRTIKLIAEYSCFPLWEIFDDAAKENLDPRELPISEELKFALFDWADKFDSTLDQNYPPDSCFASKAEEEAFEEEGEMLFQQLQRELGEDFEVLKYQHVW
jgi:hypothetical protein